MEREVTTKTMIEFQRDLERRGRRLLRAKPIWLDGRTEAFVLFHVAQ
jgi:hypothetical protein